MMAKKEVKIKEKKDYSMSALLGTFLIILISVLVFFVANFFLPFRREEMFDMAAVFTIGTILSSAMFVLSIYLIFTYLKDYLELKSKFSLGLLIMMVALMLFSITSMPPVHGAFGVFGRPGLLSIVPYLFATISLAILAWLSSK